MSDSINEQRCEHGELNAHGNCGLPKCRECLPVCPGPSVVTPPAQDEQRQTGWDYDEHPGDCHARKVDGCWVTCCRECAGTGVFPVPWIRSPEEGRARVPDDSSCVSCKGSGVSVVVAAAPSGSTEHTDEMYWRKNLAAVIREAAPPQEGDQPETYRSGWRSGCRQGYLAAADLIERVTREDEPTDG